MIKGAIIGDIIGSRFEWNNIKTKEFKLFRNKCFFTDDSVMTVALAKYLIENNIDTADDFDTTEYAKVMQSMVVDYPGRGYGSSFEDWALSGNPNAINDSWGNGAPMRVSAAGWFGNSVDDAYNLGVKSCMPSHCHPESYKAAGTVAALIWLARNSRDMHEMKAFAEQRYDIPSLEEVRPTYHFDVSCMGTMPVALAAFFESTSFEDAIRNAISVGGDSDTIAAITGGIAEAYYGIPKHISDKAFRYFSKSDVDMYKYFRYEKTE